MEMEMEMEMENSITTIWEFVGRMSGIAGLICFPLGSAYQMSLGKLGYGGLPLYLFLSSIMWTFIMMRPGKRIQVSVRFKCVAGAVLFPIICSISLVYDKYVPGKSDAYTITSVGTFALMSLSISRKLELGFETGFSAFFLQLFAAQLFKIKGFLLPVVLVFCSFLIILRHFSESEDVEFFLPQALNRLLNNDGWHRLRTETDIPDLPLRCCTSLGGVFATIGMVLFPHCFTYNMSFGKLGYGGLLLYLSACLIMWLLMHSGIFRIFICLTVYLVFAVYDIPKSTDLFTLATCLFMSLSMSVKPSSLGVALFLFLSNLQCLAFFAERFDKINAWLFLIGWGLGLCFMFLLLMVNQAVSEQHPPRPSNYKQVSKESILDCEHQLQEQECSSSPHPPSPPPPPGLD